MPRRTLRAVNGSLRAIRRVLPATITAEQALVLARAVKTSTCGKFRPISAELVAEQEGSTDYILNYNVDGATADGAAAARVNARTGKASFAGSTDITLIAVIGIRMTVAIVVVGVLLGELAGSAVRTRREVTPPTPSVRMLH